jgi:predicted permease
VAPRDFPDFDLDNPQLWLLIDQVDRLNPGTTIKDDWTSLATEVYGRLRPGISPEAATEGLRPAVLALSQLQPKRFKLDERFVAAPARDGFSSSVERRQIRMTAALIAALTLLVLLVASANLANFILSRAIGRLHEFSIRTALGATRFRIFRQMLVQCSALAIAGAAGAIALSWAAARMIAARIELPPYLDFAPDASLVVSAFVIATFAMLAFGLAPAWIVSRRDLMAAIKDGGQQASSGLARGRFRLALVGAQVLGCCAVLVVAGAVFHGLRHLLQTDPGFRVDRVVALDPSLARHGLSGENARAYWTTVKDTLAPNSQIAAMELSYPVPLGGGITTTEYTAPDGLTTMGISVGPRFFDVLEIPILAGRHFTDADNQSAVIVSRSVALRVYGSTDVIGKGFPHPRSDRTIVGVVGDAALVARRGNLTGEEYVPMQAAQYADAVLIARSRGSAELLLDPLRQAARLSDPRVLPKTVLLASAYEARFRTPRLARLISGLVASLVLALACLGIAGVIAYSVKVRTKEIGIRRALGADATQVCALLLRQLTWPIAAGLLAGTVVGITATQ